MEPFHLLEFCNRSQHLFQKRWDVFCKSQDLPETDFNIILFLANRPKENTAKDICKIRVLKPGVVSASVENLVQNGYLVRETDPSDRRRQLLFLTPKAQTIAKEGQMIIAEFYSLFSKALSSDDLWHFEESIEKFLLHIDLMEDTYDKKCQQWGVSPEQESH
ncbi:MAG: MarR family winged helix-turn-helix transcriptional regulator [Eubacteriales bacterium]